jgi:hypothetical protein
MVQSRRVPVCRSHRHDASYIQERGKDSLLKLNSRLMPGATLALATLLITGCSAQQPAPEGGAPSLCRQDAAAALTGKNRISDADARQATGASIVRQIQPGQGVTMDYRRERVTIETDPNTGKIVRASCG